MPCWRNRSRIAYNSSNTHDTGPSRIMIRTSLRPTCLSIITVNSFCCLSEKGEALHTSFICIDYANDSHHAADKYRAAWCGTSIILRRASWETSDIFDPLISLQPNCNGDWQTLRRSSGTIFDEMNAWLDHASTFLSNVGNYHVFSSITTAALGKSYISGLFSIASGHSTGEMPREICEDSRGPNAKNRPIDPVTGDKIKKWST